MPRAVHAAGGRILLHVPVTSAARTQALSATTLIAMLEAGFLGRGAGGATFAVAPDRRCCLQLELPLAGVSAALLFNAVDQLLGVAETWALRLDREPVAAVRPAGPDAPRAAIDLLARRV